MDSDGLAVCMWIAVEWSIQRTTVISDASVQGPIAVTHHDDDTREAPLADRPLGSPTNQLEGGPYRKRIELPTAVSMRFEWIYSTTVLVHYCSTVPCRASRLLSSSLSELREIEHRLATVGTVRLANAVQLCGGSICRQNVNHLSEQT